MTSPHKQAGISLIGMGILVFLIVFFGLLIVKMSGAYYDQFTLNKMIHVALDDQTAGNFSKVEFDDRMRKNMDMNNLNFDVKKIFSYEKRTNPPRLVLDYEKRVHLFFNVDVVMVFKHEYEL
jgi:hypothetical protein